MVEGTFNEFFHVLDVFQYHISAADVYLLAAGRDFFLSTTVYLSFFILSHVDFLPDLACFVRIPIVGVSLLFFLIGSFIFGCVNMGNPNVMEMKFDSISYWLNGVSPVSILLYSLEFFNDSLILQHIIPNPLGSPEKFLLLFTVFLIVYPALWLFACLGIVVASPRCRFEHPESVYKKSKRKKGFSILKFRLADQQLQINGR